MKERLVIIIIAVVAGLFVTGIGFFIYQSTQKAQTSQISDPQTQVQPTPQPVNNLYVKVSDPKDEALTTKRTIQVKGTTNPDNIVVVSTNTEDVSGKPTSDGNFSITIDIDAGANELITRSIAPDGQSITDTRTITYSTDEF